jgi:UrcA family protein
MPILPPTRNVLGKEITMSRFASSLIALAVLATPAIAFAETNAPKVRYNPAELSSPSGQQVMAQRIAQTADEWCRARAVDKTIASCRKNLVAELSAAVTAKTEMAAKTRQQRMAQK